MYLKNENLIYIGLSGDQRVYLYPQMANRHGLISGATGSGKTITLKVLAESFSSMGVPVFLADVKGDIAGMCLPGQDSPDMRKRIVKFGLGATGFDYQAFPTAFTTSTANRATRCAPPSRRWVRSCWAVCWA